MHISLILAHPDPNSLNHAIANTAKDQLEQNGHHVWYHDLYAEKFDPYLPAAEFPKDADIPENLAVYCRELVNSDGIIIVHPNWWGMPPAVLKGWIDRVIRPGVAYAFKEGDSGEGVPIGLLKAESVLVFNTSNTPEQRENDVFGDPLQRLWKDCIFDLCGVKRFYRTMYRTVVDSSTAQRAAWLANVRRTVNLCFPQNY